VDVRASTPLDLADAAGAAIFSRCVLDGQPRRLLLELTNIARLEVVAYFTPFRIKVDNLCHSELRWSDVTGGVADVARPGEGFELYLDPPEGPSYLQLIAADSLCVTVTVSLVGRSPSRYVLAQALVST
jgi:hypothetical protein